MTTFSKVVSDVANTTIPLSGTLLTTRLLARRLRADDLNSWVKLELNGYFESQPVPSYRVLRPRYQGTFLGPFGETVRNQPLSTDNFPDSIREYFQTIHLRQNIAELEHLANSEGQFLTIPQTGAVLDGFRAFSERYSGMVLNHVYCIFTKAMIVGVLHTARHRLIEFLLQLADQFPELETDESAAEKVPSEMVTEAAQQIILNGCTLLDLKGGGRMGDMYNAGQAGAMGPNAHAHDMTFNQLWRTLEKNVDLDQLVTELQNLLPHLETEANSPAHRVAIANVQAAVETAKSGDGPSTLKYLKTAGKWTLDIASKVGIGLVTAAINAQLGF